MYYKLFLTLLMFSLMECTSQNTEKFNHKFTNDLIHETSPYLLQHAHNPVQWKAWNKETLEIAKKENKLLLISIGYAACHWCHVMEHESFEDEKVAKLMNDNFICIKVDREERPDIDQIYMDAVQLLNGRGGWPLNAVALPNGKPFWGGTYFPKENWINILTEIAKLWQSNPDKLMAYAEELTDGITKNNILEFNNKRKDFSSSQIIDIVNNWRTFFDRKLGGYNQAPKFPMPNNYQFLLRHAVQSEDKELLKYVNTTLTKMAYGGIFDHIGGGFARYSTDTKWHIPHFEKMLYDNGQLVSLYSDAYLITKNDLYKEIVFQTLEFVSRELTNNKGAFYSSLDADSYNELNEKEEGAYYYWKEIELKQLLEDDFELFKDYYNISRYGIWENDNYVLIRSKSKDEIAKTHNISLNILNSKLNEWQTLLLKNREERARPNLDDKVLTSWNSLMLKGYIDAYRVFNVPTYLEAAKKNANFITKQMLRKDGGLNRNYKNGKSNINAYLEDYVTLVDALISLYEVTFEEEWLGLAKKLTDYTFTHFYDEDLHLFYFTSDEDEQLITRKIEITDNVISSSNSIMARNLFKLARYYSDKQYLEVSSDMLNNVYAKAEQYASSYANWLQLASDFSGDYYEIAITGKEAILKMKELNQFYIPNKLLVGSTSKSDFLLLRNRFDEQVTQIYICVNSSCKLPTENVQDALKQIKITY